MTMMRQNEVGDMVRWPEDSVLTPNSDRPGHRPIRQDHVMTIVAVEDDRIFRHCNCGHKWSYSAKIWDAVD